MLYSLNPRKAVVATGKFYSIHDDTLYIFKTRKDEYLDLQTIPESYNLFETESSWQLSPWIAISNNVSVESLKKIETLLELELHVRVFVDKELLESYFLDGDESVIVPELTKLKEPERAVISIKLDSS